MLPASATIPYPVETETAVPKSPVRTAPQIAEAAPPTPTAARCPPLRDAMEICPATTAYVAWIPPAAPFNGMPVVSPLP